MRSSLAVVAVAVLLSQLPADARPKPAPAGPREVYTNGYVRFADRETLPNTIYSLRGHLEVTFTPDLVYVHNVETKQSFVFPTQRLVYAGTTSIGDDDKD